MHSIESKFGAVNRVMASLDLSLPKLSGNSAY